MIFFRMMHPPIDWAWIKSQIPVMECSDTCGVMAIKAESYEPLGAVVFDNFLRNSARVSICLKTSIVLRYGFLQKCFEFAFKGCGLEYLYSMIAENNEPSLRLNRKLGFKEKMRMPDGYEKGIDYVITELHKDNLRGFKNGR